MTPNPDSERRERARRAGLDPDELDAYVSRVVRRAGDLSAEDLDKLRALLPPVKGGQ